MNTAEMSAIIGALSALLGTGIGAIIQMRIAKATHAFHLQSEAAKRRADTAERKNIEKTERLIAVHRSISAIERGFSFNEVYRAWRADTPYQEFDQRYIECCAALDEARAICDLLFPEASEHLEKMYNHMGEYWLHFSEMLNMNALQKPTEFFHGKTSEASRDIESCASAAKDKLKKYELV